jgi:hypothetical protein
VCEQGENAVTQAGFVIPKIGLDGLGLKNHGHLYWNLTVPLRDCEGLSTVAKNSQATLLPTRPPPHSLGTNASLMKQEKTP